MFYQIVDLRAFLISTYINTKMSAVLSVHVFLGHFETDWKIPWQKLAYFFWECSKAITFYKNVIF